MLAVVFGHVAQTILLKSLLIMQRDRLGQDHASIIRNREVSLVQRSDKYMFLWRPFGTVDGRLYNGGILIFRGP